MAMIKNINELAKKAQEKMAMWVLVGVAILVFIGWFFIHPDKGHKQGFGLDQESTKTMAKLDGINDAQFTQDASKQALEVQQREIKELTDKLGNISDQLDILQQSLDAKGQNDADDNQVALAELQGKILELEGVIKNGGNSTSTYNSVNPIFTYSHGRGITSTTFSYGGEQHGSFAAQVHWVSVRNNQDQSQSHDQNQNIVSSYNKGSKTTKDYVPPGTFASAILLNGADTNAGVNGQTDTTPITLKILDNGTLPNGGRSSLKGCFVTAAAYGDPSSERGQIRLQRLSCVKKPGNHVLDIAVEGTVNDMGGSDGIRGHVVMRNNKLIWNAGVAGMLSGIGSAMQQSLSTQSVSALGATSVIKSGKVFEHSAYGGANTALGKLADYYIKLADMYHPIVQIHAGSKVNIVFLKGFSLTEEQSSRGAVFDSLDQAQNKDVNQNQSQNQEQVNSDSGVKVETATFGSNNLLAANQGQGVPTYHEQAYHNSNLSTAQLGDYVDLPKKQASKEGFDIKQKEITTETINEKINEKINETTIDEVAND